MLLFVYGTMLSIGRNHPRLWECNAVRIGRPDQKFTTYEAFEMFVRPDRAPVVIEGPGGSAIRCPVEGELYAVPDDQIGHIDLFEGHPHVYVRERVGIYQMHPEIEVQFYRYVGEVAHDFVRVHEDDGVLRYQP